MGNTNVRESAVVAGGGGVGGGVGGGGGGGGGGGLQQRSAAIGVGHGDVQQVPSYGGAPQPTFIHAQQRAAQVASVDSMGGQSSSNSPGSAARSPLLFAHEEPGSMAPMPKTGESRFYGSPEKAVAALIMWSYGGNSVSVMGSWDNWSTRQLLHRSGRDFTLIKVLQPGVYQFKFFVDGEWRHSPDLATVSDDVNDMINLLDVTDYVPDNLESVAGFDAPMSPDSSYNDPVPGPDDFTKEPPTVPSQLHMAVLNVVSESLPRPQHVVLKHLFVEKEQANCSVLVLSVTNRFRSKYVTNLLYKPSAMQ